jgi:hypothetical protein
MSVQFPCLIEVLVASCFTLGAVIRGTPVGLGQRASSEQADQVKNDDQAEDNPGDFLKAPPLR